MIEGIVLSLEHLLDITCQVQTRCRSFSNANRKDLRTAFMLHSILGLFTLPLRLPFALQLPFLHFSPAYDQSPNNSLSLLRLLLSSSFSVCGFGDFLCCMIMNCDSCSPPPSAPSNYLSTNLIVPILKPPISAFAVSP